MPRNADMAVLGRAVVRDGRLGQLQARIQFSHSMMAELLYVAPGTYKQWITNPGTQLWHATAEKVGRFYSAALNVIAVVRRDGIDIDTMMPLHHAAMNLGTPLEVMLTWFNEYRIDGADLGLLGVWVYTSEVARIKEARRHVAA